MVLFYQVRCQTAPQRSISQYNTANSAAAASGTPITSGRLNSVGGGTDASMWRLLQAFLVGTDDPETTAQKLEDAARVAWGES